MRVSVAMPAFPVLALAVVFLLIVFRRVGCFRIAIWQAMLGGASNVIIIQNAERRSGETLTLREFARLGAPVTAQNVLVYWVFLVRV